MSQSSNKELSQSIFAIVAILAVVAIVEAFVLSMMYGGIGNNQMDTSAPGMAETSSVDDRLRPVVTLADIRDESSAKTEMAAAPVAVVASKSAKELYDGACMACHANAVGGAPKPGDKAAWEPRFANGADSLLASVVNGKGIMPAKGGSTYSDDELTQAINYMLEGTGLNAVAADAPVMQEKQPMVAVEPAKDTMVDSMDTIAGEEALAYKNETNEMDLAAGETSYRAACFACHDFGVAGAPKLGDSSAWSARKNKGMDSLNSNAINGMGAMPAKGGAAYLSDADVKNIVAFMMSKI